MREAHGLKAAGRLDEAIGRYGEALAANPGSAFAEQNLAAALTDASRWTEAEPHIRAAMARGLNGPETLLILARCELGLDRVPEALDAATRAHRLAPQDFAPQVTLAEAFLATGEAQRATDLAGDIRRRWSTSQYAIALQATAWRMLGDARYRQLYDYASLVWTSPLDIPPGWPSLQAYVVDVAKALKAIPPGQSSDVLNQPHPALRALPQALDGPIRLRLSSLGTGDDPARARNRGTYALQGIRLVQQQPGAHTPDRVHPQGWLSAVCMIETGQQRGGDGWLSFGRPGMKTMPALAAEHHVEPEAGLLVLFPSYMWNGAEPLGGKTPQLSLIFDLAPGAVELPDMD